MVSSEKKDIFGAITPENISWISEKIDITTILTKNVGTKKI